MASEEVCRAFRNTGKCRYGDSCNFVHSEGEFIEPPPRGQCFNWEKDGSCEYGERCRYLHGADDDGSRFERKPKLRKPREPRGDGDGDGDGEPRKRRERKPRPPPTKLDEQCNNYTEGRCPYGDDCRRKHDPPGIEQKVTKIDEVCNNFLEGRCRFGDMCRRQHPAQ